MTEVIGRAFGPLAEGEVDGYVDELLWRYEDRLAGSASVVVLPDAFYPYHPTTGLVTNPAVVAAATRSLERLIGPSRLTVAVAGSSWSPAAQVSAALGYPDLLADTRVDVVHLDEASVPPEQAGDDGEALSIPSILEESTVVNLPTLRRSAALGMVAGLGNLAQAVTSDPTPDAVLAAADRIETPVTLLDGTYVFDGTPSAPRFLLASDDRVALDRVGAALLGLDADAVPYLDEPTTDAASLLDGFRLRSVRSDVRRGGTIDRNDGPGGLVTAGYRLYSRISGDLLPPQFLGDADG